MIDKDGTRLGIAAKRPRGQNGIRRNLEKAAKQINKSAIDGFIALDCSFAAADGKSLTTTKHHAATISAKTILHNFLEQNLLAIRAVNFGPRVIGLILSLHIPVTLMDEKWERALQMASAFRWTVLPLITAQDMRFKTVLNFAEQCQLGLFNGPSSS